MMPTPDMTEAERDTWLTARAIRHQRDGLTPEAAHEAAEWDFNRAAHGGGRYDPEAL
jgi:hypothetical protein